MTDPAPLPTDIALTDPYRISPTGKAILGLLHGGASVHRVIAIGRYHGTWRPTEVRWAYRRYIDYRAEAGQWKPPGFTPSPPDPHCSAPPRITLCQRQQQVLDRLCRGYDLPQIADELGVARCTVRGYARALRRALHTVTLDEAVVRARTGQVRLFVAPPTGRPLTPPPQRLQAAS